MTKSIIFILLLVSIFKIAFSLDSPAFWNQYQMKVLTTTTQNIDFYYGWDTAFEYIYFRFRRSYSGWLALGFGNSFNGMDMIALRLQSLRVVAEDRYGVSEADIPQLNNLSRDTYLIKGVRDSTTSPPIWDITFKRKAVSSDPKKVLLDDSMRYLTIILGDSLDYEMTNGKKYSSNYEMAFTKQQVCHQTCNTCTGPGESECSDCSISRVLYQNKCVLRNPSLFTLLFKESTKKYSISYGLSDNLVYFKLSQDTTWKYWMGVMIDYQDIAKITDFITVYQISSSSTTPPTVTYLTGDYFIDWKTSVITDDELVGSGNNDVFITESSANYVTIARYIDTGSTQYDQKFDKSNDKLNVTLLIGNFDLYESESTPFTNSNPLNQQDPTTPLDPKKRLPLIGNDKCDESCLTCMFDDSSSNCLSCLTSPVPLPYLDSKNGVTSCSSLCTSINCYNKKNFATNPLPSFTSADLYLIKTAQYTVQYILNADNTVFSFSVPLVVPKIITTVQQPTQSAISYNAVSLSLQFVNTSPSSVIFLFCQDDITKPPLAIYYSFDQVKYTKDLYQIIAVDSGDCNNSILKAALIMDGAIDPSQSLEMSLNLHVSKYDLQSYQLTNIKWATPTVAPVSCSQCSVFSSLNDNFCSNTLIQPYCCAQDSFSLSGTFCVPYKTTYWNQIYMNGNQAIVNYATYPATDTIFFKYDFFPTQTQGWFGCGFGGSDVNTDMIIVVFNGSTITIRDYFSYGSVEPQLDTIQNLIVIDQSYDPTQKFYSITFARGILSSNNQDKNLSGYSGSLLCYLGNGLLSDLNREKYFMKTVSFSATTTCHSSCSSCSCNPSITSSCQMICNTCISGYVKSTYPAYQCELTILTSCATADPNCAQCKTNAVGDCIKCNDLYFLYSTQCFPQTPNVFYSSEVALQFQSLGFSLSYGFDNIIPKYIYLNFQGKNNGYISIGIGSHSTGMDIIMISNTLNNQPVVTDMYSDYTTYITSDTQQNTQYVIGSMDVTPTYSWNITVFRPLDITDAKQDLPISLTNTNIISLALGYNFDIFSHHKSTQIQSTLFPQAQTKSGKLQCSGTYIQELPVLYNRINTTKIAGEMYYGYDATNSFIYFKLVTNFTGWIGMGFGDSMTSTDIITVSAKDLSFSEILVEDRFSDGQKLPRLDSQQDVVFISKNLDQSSKNYTISFVRKLKTADAYSEDTDLIYDPTASGITTNLIFAQGQTSLMTSSHSVHITLRNVLLKSTLDCSHCSEKTCTGPLPTDCTGVTAEVTEDFGAVLKLNMVLTLMMIAFFM